MAFFVNPTATPDRNNKLFRWSLQLHQFQNLHVWHIAGDSNKMADVMSRLSVYSAKTNAACVAAVSAFSMSVAPVATTPSLDFFELSKLTDKIPSTAQDWLAAQRADKTLAATLDYLNNGTLPTVDTERKTVINMADSVFLHPTSRILVRKPHERKATMSTFSTPLRIVVPPQLQETMVKLFHDDVANGMHRGEQETYQRIAERLWWIGMHAAVSNYLKICMDCAQVKQRRPPSNARPHTTDPPSEPFEAVHIDFLYVTPSQQGNKYLLVLICALTGWIELWPCKSADAATVLHHLRVDVLARHLRTPRLISDNGSHFSADSLAQLVKELNTKHSFCAPYHPQANGKVERVNRTVLEMLRIYAHDWQQHWDEDDTITPLLQHLRATISSVTGFAPYELLYARQRHFPADEMLRAAIESPVSENKDLAQQQRRRLEAASKAYATTRELLNTTHNKLYNDDDAKFVDLPTYAVGDTVWLYSPSTPSGEIAKTARLWRGPYIMREHKGSTLGKKYQTPVDTRTFLVKGLQVHEGRVGRGSAFSHIYCHQTHCRRLIRINTLQKQTGHPESQRSTHHQDFRAPGRL